MRPSGSPSRRSRRERQRAVQRPQELAARRVRRGDRSQPASHRVDEAQPPRRADRDRHRGPARRLPEPQPHEAKEECMSSFTPATRTSTKARIALCGPSGSGKTWTALTLAHALGEHIAVIDTERGSASKYAGVNGWKFDTVAPGS